MKTTMSGHRCQVGRRFLEKEGEEEEKEEEKEEEGRLCLGLLPMAFVHRSLRLRHGERIRGGTHQ